MIKSRSRFMVIIKFHPFIRFSWWKPQHMRFNYGLVYFRFWNRRYPDTIMKQKEGVQDETFNDQALPIPIQIFLWRQISPFIKPKLGKLHEATCMVRSVLSCVVFIDKFQSFHGGFAIATLFSFDETLHCMCVRGWHRSEAQPFT